MAARNCCKCVTVSLVPTASLILVMVFACGIILLPILYIELSHEYQYGIIIDAGSSHTDLYGYRWRVPTHNRTGVVEINVDEIYHCPSKVSINGFATNPKEAPSAFEDCLRRSETVDNVKLPIDDHTRPSTPIYLGATAGMRILNMTHEYASEEILRAVRHSLKKSNYSFVDSNAGIISGEQEAIGGWTTANYLEGQLNPPGDKTIGSLDLGGASAEIAFQVFDNLSGFTLSETLFGRKYSVFARSYLCYGQNEAYSRFLAHLHKKAGHNGTVNNPCLIAGAKVIYHYNDVYSGCANGSAAIEAFGFGYAPPTSLQADDDIVFNGTWNFDECRKEIGNVFNFTQCWPESNCKPANNFTLPPVNGSFVGFAAFYWTAKYFNQSGVTFSNTNHAWGSFNNTIRTNCTQSGNDSCAINGKVKKSCFQYCFNGMFMVFLLDSGFGFSNNSAHDWTVKFQQQVKDISVGWALGYMLNKTIGIPQNNPVELRPYDAVDLVVGILILSILCVVFVIFFFLTFYACQKSLRARSGFKPL